MKKDENKVSEILSKLSREAKGFLILKLIALLKIKNSDEMNEIMTDCERIAANNDDEDIDRIAEELERFNFVIKVNGVKER